MLVRRIRSRGANVVVEANGEVLFAPGAQISNWKNRFSQRVRKATEAYAPTNKRPRWGHYGKPLKSSFKASTSTRLTKGGGFFYIAVGSTAKHAYYVDQGTGIYNGSSPYKAKVLPPWQRGEGSLYEHTWRPGGPGTRRVKPVYIKGQRGQGFFDKGLKRGFQSMRLRSFQVPGEGVSGMAGALSSFPTGLANFKGNTAADAGFIRSLEMWREWRDEAWQRNDGLGRRVRPEREPDRPAAPKPPKAVKPPKPPKPPKPKGLTTEQRGDIARAIGSQLRAQGRQFRNLRVLDNGTWTALIKAPGQNIFKPVTGRWRS